MRILRALRRNRLLTFGVVATCALLVSMVVAFGVHVDEMLAFLWQVVVMIVVMIISAALLFGLALGLRTLFGRGGD